MAASSVEQASDPLPGVYAGSRFDLLPPQERPAMQEEVDRLLSPAVQVVCRMPAPIETDPQLTAIKR